VGQVAGHGEPYRAWHVGPLGSSTSCGCTSHRSRSAQVSSSSAARRHWISNWSRPRGTDLSTHLRYQRAPVRPRDPARARPILRSSRRSVVAIGQAQKFRHACRFSNHAHIVPSAETPAVASVIRAPRKASDTWTSLATGDRSRYAPIGRRRTPLCMRAAGIQQAVPSPRVPIHAVTPRAFPRLLVTSVKGRV
jgi:hypothetical protein